VLIRHDQTTILALYRTVQWALPTLEANFGKVAKPSILVTNSFLYKAPSAALFSLTTVKAAQRALVQCMRQEFAGSGVHIGLVSVGGVVSDDHPTRNAKNIAAKTWGFYEDAANGEEVEIP
jgi:NADP-dependent 3-hydroxy acid dehydrogenase YdfG